MQNTGKMPVRPYRPRIATRQTMAGVPRCTVIFSKTIPLRLASAWLAKFW